MRNLLLQTLCCLLLLLSFINASNEKTPQEKIKSTRRRANINAAFQERINFFEPKTPDDLNSTLDAYADSYREAAHDKFLMIEIQTYKDPQNVEGTIKPEILRLEHLYQSKWAKEFLESIGAEDKKLVNFSIDEYRKALEEDASFNYAVLANKGFYNQTKTHISKKWENRKTLDIAEGKLFAQTSGNLNKHKVQIEMIRKDVMEAKEAVKTSKAKLKALETAALITSNAYTSTSTYLRSVRRGIFTNGEKQFHLF
ncbi:unnamed protein product [Trichobilharzia szidati]|nr:unnamed protein product [Trichobilharzia szidati]